jgi:hypothetical protein
VRPALPRDQPDCVRPGDPAACDGERRIGGRWPEGGIAGPIPDDILSGIEEVVAVPQPRATILTRTANDRAALQD